MADSGINPLTSGILPVNPLERPGVAGTGNDETVTGELKFTEVLRNQLDSMIELQNQAETMSREFAAGRIDDFESVTLAVQKADLALNFALQLRNKVIEAYQEISRMQV